MAASSEVARQNGKKSRGPVTERGKTIAAKNATKHGILAQEPPLLVTEDLETFQGIMQGLIDEYQPASPTEHLLVQQVAMSWLRLHRLWGVEAAIANKEMLKAQKEAKYPDHNPFEITSSKTQFHPEVLRGEQSALQGLITDLEYDLTHLPESPSNYEEWFQAVAESLGDAKRSCPDEVKLSQADKVWKLREDLLYSLDYWDEEEEASENPVPTVERVTAQAQALIKSAKKRLKDMNQILADIEFRNQAIQKAEAVSKGLQSPEVFSRYERQITRQLYEVLDRLSAIVDHRNQGDSIGSFEQIQKAMLAEKARKRLEQKESSAL